MIRELRVQAATYTEVHLTDDGQVEIYAEAETGETYAYSLDEAKALMAALGRVIWLAENPEDD